MKNRIIFFLLLCLGAACKPNVKESNSTTSATPTADTYGEVITPEGAASVADIMANLQANDSISGKVSGYITSVCKKKGCWMILSHSPTDSTGLFVKFKDYGFFMPLDCEGSRVVMRGVAYNEVTPVDELKHYAEDEGKSAEEIAKITSPQVEKKYMADGVVMVERKSTGK
ncbi:MAG: DUF4920 domain-containing protein [Saprospiraceae bacterium]